ncbi:MAG: hypothetical protein WCG27_02020 [Pseudomonadota bacterium]
MKKSKVLLFIFAVLFGLFGLPLISWAEDDKNPNSNTDVNVQKEDLSGDQSFKVETTEPADRSLASEELRDLKQEKQIDSEIKYWKYDK